MPSYDVASTIHESLLPERRILRQLPHVLWRGGLGRAVQVETLKRVETCVERAWFQPLKLEYDEPLSNIAFNFNLRPYSLAMKLDARMNNTGYCLIVCAVAMAGGVLRTSTRPRLNLLLLRASRVICKYKHSP